MSIKHTNVRFLTTGATTAWSNQATVSLSAFLMIDPASSLAAPALGNTWILSKQFGDPKLVFSSNGSANSLNTYIEVSNQSGSAAAVTTPFKQGSVYHVGITYTNGLQTLYIDGVLTAWQYAGTLIGNTDGSTQAIYLGPQNNPGPGLIMHWSDLSIYNGYAATQQDYIDLLRRVKDPSGIGTGTVGMVRYWWPLTGTTNATVTVGDPGLADVFGSGVTFNTISGSGSAVYSPPLTFTVAALTNPYICTSGKTVGFLFNNLIDGTLLYPTAVLTAPTFVQKNSGGTTLASGTLVAPAFTTSHHQCALMRLPVGVSCAPSDTLALTAPQGWIVTSAGFTAALASQVIANYTGKSAVGSDSVPKTFKPGWNLGESGYRSSDDGAIMRNWSLRAEQFTPSRVSAWTDDGRPLTLIATPLAAAIISAINANSVDQTVIPPLTGLWACGWDDHDPAHPTTFTLENRGDAGVFSVTPRADLDNAGTLIGGVQVGRVKVFQITALTAVGSNTILSIILDAPALAPRFNNLAVYGPGDFTAVAPVVLDTTDRFAHSQIWKDRFRFGAGVIRILDSTLVSSGVLMSREQEQYWQTSDFTFGLGQDKYRRTVFPTSVRPWTPTNSPYIYTTLFGSEYPVTLAANISDLGTLTPITAHDDLNNATVSLNTTLLVSTVQITVDPANPVIVGLRLRAGSELMRILSIAQAGSIYNCSVERGTCGTTPATHPAGIIACQNRYSLLGPALTISGITGDGHTSTTGVKVLTATVHNLVDGDTVWFTGSTGMLSQCQVIVSSPTAVAVSSGMVGIVTGLTGTSTVTITTRHPHQRTAGQWVDIEGLFVNPVTPVLANSNGIHQIATTPTTTTFTLAGVTETQAYYGGGIVTRTDVKPGAFVSGTMQKVNIGRGEWAESVFASPHLAYTGDIPGNYGQWDAWQFQDGTIINDWWGYPNGIGLHDNVQGSGSTNPIYVTGPSTYLIQSGALLPSYFTTISNTFTMPSTFPGTVTTTTGSTTVTGTGFSTAIVGAWFTFSNDGTVNHYQIQSLDPITPTTKLYLSIPLAAPANGAGQTATLWPAWSSMFYPPTAAWSYAMNAMNVAKIKGCNIVVNISHAASDSFVWFIAREIRDHFPSGRTVYIEYGNEPWNSQIDVMKFTNTTSGILFPNNFVNCFSLCWYSLRATQIKNIFIQAFNENGINRGNEIKVTNNFQLFDSGSMIESTLDFAIANNCMPDVLMIAPYTSYDAGATLPDGFTPDPAVNIPIKKFYWAGDDDQALDLWVHNLYFNDNGRANAVLVNIRSLVDHYNVTYGLNITCMGYEGNTVGCYISDIATLNGSITSGQTNLPLSPPDGWTDLGVFLPNMYVSLTEFVAGVPVMEWVKITAVHATSVDVLRGQAGTTAAAHPNGRRFATPFLERARDICYNPNIWVAEQDFFHLLDKNRFSEMNTFFFTGGLSDISIPANWFAPIHSQQQLFGRGDGSDGRFNNRTMLAMPGKTGSKTPSDNQEINCVSPRAGGWYDWMQQVVSTTNVKARTRPLTYRR